MTLTTSDGAEPVDVDGLASVRAPLGGFGDLSIVGMEPRVQIAADYGILASDVQTLTTSNGTGTAAAGMFVCTTSADAGSYAVIRSRRLVRYRAGQACRFMLTAMFTTPVANSQQLAGAFTATDGLFFGYVGTEFGVMRRVAGATAIHRLTVTVGSGGAETITVTLNGVAFAFPSGGALSTSALAELIAEQTSAPYTGWSSTAPQSVGATVTWLQDIPATTGGAFTLTSSGTAAGTFATVQAGAPNVITGATVWVPQASWNVDTMDGNGPSGVTLDPTKLNLFRIVMPHFGAGALSYAIMLPTGEWQTVHKIRYPNQAIIPSQRNPTLRLGWIAASVGSTSVLAVKGASAAGFREGTSQTAVRDPRCRERIGLSVTSTETTALVLRVRSELGGTVNLRELWPHTLNASNETANRNVLVRCYINATLSGTVNYTSQDSESAVDYATPAITPTGTPFSVVVIPGAGAADNELHEHEVRLGPGDTLTISVATTSASATVDLSITWHEF